VALKLRSGALKLR